MLTIHNAKQYTFGKRKTLRSDSLVIEYEHHVDEEAHIRYHSMTFLFEVGQTVGGPTPEEEAHIRYHSMTFLFEEAHIRYHPTTFL